jgi:hypothetical protein
MISIRVYLEIATVLFIAIVFGWYTMHERGVGEHKIEAADQKVVAAAEEHNASAEFIQKAADSAAESKLNAALNTPIGALPSVASLQPAPSPGPVPNARSNPSKSVPATVVRTEAPASVVQVDWSTLERSDVQSAHDADAEVIYLQGLLANQYALCKSP